MVHKSTMKNFFLIIIILNFFTIKIFAKNYSFEKVEWIYTFAEKYYFNNGNYLKRIMNFDNSYTEEKGFYTINENNGYIIANIEYLDGKIDEVFIFNYMDEHLIMYNKTKKNQIECTNAKYNVDESWIWPINNCSASSYLTEFLSGIQVSYNPENLELRDLSKNWVEGVKGLGIGEKINFYNFEIEKCKSLFILNGFFDPDKTYLFNQNSRIKRIILRGGSKDKFAYEKEYELYDNTSLQKIEIDKAFDYYELEILDVYPGSKYSDTALSGIFFDGLSVSYD